MSPKVFITQRIPDSGPNLLKEKLGTNVEYREKDGILSKEEMIAHLQDKDAVLCLLTDMMDEQVFAACPNLKIVANYAVGFNNIDVKAATQRGIMVTNTPGVLDDTTADLAFTLMMAAGRRIVAADQYMRSGQFKAWEPMGFLGQDISGATLGIIGLGRIGSGMAKRAYKGFNMKVLYYDVSQPPELDFPIEKTDLDTLLRQSDFVSLHVPLLESTRHMIGVAQLAMMKPTAYLINTARGPVVDEKALYEALKAKKIAGAGLDVYEAEPAFYPGLNALDNVVMVPHIGSASIQTRQKMSLTAASNIVDWVEGKAPRTIVNKEVLK